MDETGENTLLLSKKSVNDKIEKIHVKINSKQVTKIQPASPVKLYSR